MRNCAWIKDGIRCAMAYLCEPGAVSDTKWLTMRFRIANCSRDLGLNYRTDSLWRVFTVFKVAAKVCDTHGLATKLFEWAEIGILRAAAQGQVSAR